MVDGVFVVDSVRVLTALGVFGYASYRDVLERRVRHHVWYPAVFIGIIALVVDFSLRDPEMVLFFGSMSLLMGFVFGYGFYYLGTFGGADRYALVVIALLFPVYPMLPNPMDGSLPLVVPNAPIFLLSVLGNAVILGLVYPGKLLVENIASRNYTSPVLMFLCKRVAVPDLHNHFGKVVQLEEDDASIWRSGVFSRYMGVNDIDFVRDYVEWRGVESLGEIDSEDLELEEFIEETDWMSDDIDGDEEDLAAIIDLDYVWISPGIPFIVPVYAGLIAALTYGDILFTVLQLVFDI